MIVQKYSVVFVEELETAPIWTKYRKAIHDEFDCIGIGLVQRFKTNTRKSHQRAQCRRSTHAESVGTRVRLKLDQHKALWCLKLRMELWQMISYVYKKADFSIGYTLKSTYEMWKDFGRSRLNKEIEKTLKHFVFSLQVLIRLLLHFGIQIRNWWTQVRFED